MKTSDLDRNLGRAYKLLREHFDLENDLDAIIDNSEESTTIIIGDTDKKAPFQLPFQLNEFDVGYVIGKSLYQFSHPENQDTMRSLAGQGSFNEACQYERVANIVAGLCGIDFCSYEDGHFIDPFKKWRDLVIERKRSLIGMRNVGFPKGDREREFILLKDLLQTFHLSSLIYRKMGWLSIPELSSMRAEEAKERVYEYTRRDITSPNMYLPSSI